MALPLTTRVALAVLVGLAGCARFPGLEAGPPLPPSTGVVELLPLDQILEMTGGGAVDDTAGAELLARAARLRARVNATGSGSGTVKSKGTGTANTGDAPLP